MQIFTSPKTVLRDQREKGITEQGNLALLLLFTVLNFFAQLPGLSRVFAAGPQTSLNRDGVEVPIDFAEFVGWQAVFSIFGVALVMYGFAAIAHLVMRKYAGKATWVEARRTMFLAAVVSLPLIALSAAITWFGIPNLSVFISLGTLIYFLWYWQQGLNALEFDNV